MLTSKNDFQHSMPLMSLMPARDNCIVQHDGYGPKRVKNHYKKSFTVTCKKGRHTMEWCTNSNTMHQNVTV